MKLTRLLLAIFLLFGVSLITGCDDDCVGTVGTSCKDGDGGGGDDEIIDGKLISMRLALDKTALAAGESTNIRVTFVDQDNVAQTGNANLDFTSTCAAIGLASITGSGSSSNGGVTVVYKANGCKGNDVIAVSGSFEEKSYSGEITVNVAADEVTFIEWVSTVPSQLAIKGSGGQETAVVTFRLNGESGANVIGETVAFSIAGKSGGLILVNTTAVSDSDGLVRAIVQAGSFPATPTIIATFTHPDGSIESTPSNGLVVANGLASDTNFNMGVTVANPHAWSLINHDSVGLTVAVNDKAANKVADGSVVNFVAEDGYGIVEESCKTKDGLCSVTWISTGKNAPDGRVKIFATVKGTEDFVDTNGNLIFDDGDTFLPSQDLAEPYSDWNDNGVYDFGEYFVDSNLDGVRSPGDGKWNGLHCEHPLLCSDNAVVDLGIEVDMVQSDNVPVFYSEGTLGDITVVSQGSYDLSGVVIGDLNMNSLPHGATYSYSVEKPEYGKIIGGSGFIGDLDLGLHYVLGATYIAPKVDSGFVSGVYSFTIRTHELVTEIPFFITIISNSFSQLYEVLEDSASFGGAFNANGKLANLALIGLGGYVSAYDSAYHFAISIETGFSSPPTLEQVQAIIDTVNSNIAYASIVEDIAGNADGISATATQINSISGVSGAIAANEAAYTKEFIRAKSIGGYANSAQPTADEILLIVQRVNASEAGYAEVVEDIAGNANGKVATALQINQIIGMGGIAIAANEKAYAAAFVAANPDGYANPFKPTLAEIKAIINAVNGP